jgi:hypothetical protein
MIRTTKESHARKAIGEPLQLWLVEQLRSLPTVTDPSMIQSQKMSAHGEDIIIDDEVRRSLPVSFECKVAANGFGKTYAAHEQAMRQVDAMAKAVEIIPISVIQEHGREPLAVMSTNHLMKMFCAILSFTPIAEGANDNEIH